MTLTTIPRESIDLPMLNVGVQPMRPSEVIDWIDDHVGRRALLLNHNLHSLYIHETSEEFRSAYAMSDATLIDGFPILAAVNVARLRSGQRPLASDSRTGSCDWLGLLGRSRRVRRIAVLGADQESNEKACCLLRAIDPRFSVRGWDGFGELNSLRDRSFDELHEFGPDLVLLGLGMPLQEELIVKSRSCMPDAVVATVGGAIDQLSGRQRCAPRWVGRFGAEWLYRLAHDPRRLYHRYLIEPWLLARALHRSER